VRVIQENLHHLDEVEKIVSSNVMHHHTRVGYATRTPITTTWRNGCEGWYSARVTTCGELDAAIAKAESCGTGAFSS